MYQRAEVHLNIFIKHYFVAWYLQQTEIRFIGNDMAQWKQIPNLLGQAQDNNYLAHL